MTTATDLQLPTITCPSSLIASCPPLLGFHPENSLICLVHSPGSTRPVVARVDVVADDDAEHCAADLAARLARTQRSVVTLVLWIEASDETRRGDVPGLALIEQLGRSLREQGMEVDFAVATNGQVWWPLLCSDPACCSDLARPLDAAVAGRVQVQYAVAGFAPLATRADLARRLDSDPLSVARTRRYLAETPAVSTSLAARRRRVDQLWRVLRPAAGHEGRGDGQCDPARHEQGERRGVSLWPQPGSARGKAASPESAIRALGDLGVRDALLVRFATDQCTCHACWRRSVAVLVDVVRAAPPGLLAPSATLLAQVAWLSGDGALASVAIERALTDDPGYRLAGLVSALISSGLDPQAWRASTASLTEDECLRRTRQASRGAPR